MTEQHSLRDQIIQRLNDLFVECLHIDAPPPDADLFDSGILDSLQLVELLLQLERRFRVRVAVESIDLERLRTLERIALLVEAASPVDISSAKKVA